MKNLKSLLALALLSAASLSVHAHKYNDVYVDHELDHIAFPVGGIGTGMFCIEGTGAVSHVSVRHQPNLFCEPCMFSSIHVKGVTNGTKVLEAGVPDYKKFGRRDCGGGIGGSTFGLPRFDKGTFTSRFPFATIELEDADLPLTVSLCAWSPFTPGDADDSSLPVGCLEYTFTNTSDSTLEAVYSFNSWNFLEQDAPHGVRPVRNGFALYQEGTANNPEWGGSMAFYTDDPRTTVDCCWFRGGWWDPLTMAWNHACTGKLYSQGEKEDARGGSLYVPLTIVPGESRTVRLYVTWYFPDSNIRNYNPATDESDFGSCYDPARFADTPERYQPYYSRLFPSLEAVADYWLHNYDRLRKATRLFTDAFYDSTLPAEVLEAVAANMSILKSTTVLREHDGRFLGWEGSGDNWGSCQGTTTHVWTYTQSLCHLFPALERTLRDTEFLVDQDTYGHQAFRSNMPVCPIHHDFHAAADGQLGGIIKMYRDWRISGDTEWLRTFYPQIKQSLDYCIRTWDPHEVGALMEPHHNTYDIEFWGADGMCTSYYVEALNAFIQMSKHLKKDCRRYEKLFRKSVAYMNDNLWNGEYFYQRVQWEGLDAPSPVEVQSYNSGYTPEALEILQQEGPKYQYGTGCLSDGVLGCWIANMAGLQESIDHDKVRSHLLSVYKYNMRHDLTDHANPQRPGYALGREGGLLICSWPHGGMPQLPFIYSNEVWTGIEYQVASHLILEGAVDEGLDIVRTVRDRYDGVIRNPYNEYECGNFYARAMSSYGLLQALTGARYDAVDKTLYIDSRVGDDFRSFLSTDSGFGVVGLQDGKPFVDVRHGTIDVKNYVVSGKKVKL